MLTHWKTTLFGTVAGVSNLLANGTSWKHVLLSVAMMGLGLVSHDFNVPSQKD